MKKILMTCLCLTLTACEPTKPAEPEASPSTEAKPTAGDEAKPTHPEVVEVAAKGTEFEPAVDISQMPEGAYYCDMGTVHYARMDEGDGKCGLCGMALKHADAPKKGDGDHAGHEH